MIWYASSRYRKDAPIVFHLDSGYMDQKLFEAMEACDAGYVCGGKLYSDITDAVREIPQKAWGCYFGSQEIEDGGVWEYVEFGDRRSSWKRGVYLIPWRHKTSSVCWGVSPT